MFLVVGLGNPGSEYASNRHNIGFMAADELVRRHSFSAWRTKYQAQMADGTIGDDRVLLLKPMTYMNRSGQSVGDACRFYKIPPEKVIVFHDELELAPGKVRVKQGGGHAGHNGLRDIDAHIGKDYWRVRLGIGRPHDKALVHKWVLSDFGKADAVWLEPFLDAVARNTRALLTGDHSGFMNRVTLATQPAKPKGEKGSKKGAEKPPAAEAEGAALSSLSKSP
jgi:PTH1 family peptidyl-tRNA hydrolase